ncbi:DUF488 domain-containing protein [Thauera aromatica]|uniref:Uroporphyrin-III c-methyltransferase n=1 Tax=Thauera aromatica K172 TaxID=44139 RepID=A0A2R4BS33_THAAR|nr:DUF488 domain-containing protein [Thauera aromatica]AVR90023.1 hypothetical protein Tharo_3142 [Thauera aromatica K172]
MPILVKRIHDAAAPGDGCRVLVDRLWPRGLTKARAAVDLWLRELAPSTALRQWFGHDPTRWDEFRRRYAAELDGDGPAPALAQLRELRARHPVLTLLYAARDPEHNNAVALRAWLEAADDDSAAAP